MGLNQAAQMAFQQMGENGGEDYFDEEEEVDEDGQPLPSADQIRNIINSIPSYRYEEIKEEEPGKTGRSSTKSIKPSDQCRVTCSICLDGARTG